MISNQKFYRQPKCSACGAFLNFITEEPLLLSQIKCLKCAFSKTKVCKIASSDISINLSAKSKHKKMVYETNFDYLNVDNDHRIDILNKNMQTVKRTMFDNQKRLKLLKEGLNNEDYVVEKLFSYEKDLIEVNERLEKCVKLSSDTKNTQKILKNLKCNGERMKRKTTNETKL